MKNLTLIACLCFVTAAYAGNGKQHSGVVPNQIKLEKRINEPVVKYIGTDNTLSLNREDKTEDLQFKSPIKPAFLSKKTMLNEKELREMAAYAVTEQCDSVVSGVHSTGEKYSKQAFEFYADTHLPKQRINSMWDAKTNSWNPEEIYTYTWDKDGYCLTQEVYYPNANVGARNVFTYNAQKLGDSQTVYKYDLTLSDDWYVTEKGEYEYDSKGGMTKETRYQWNGTSWAPYDMTNAAWDSQRRMILNETYVWDNKWIGKGDKKEWLYDKNGNMLLEHIYYWEEESNNWFNYMIIEQAFLGDDAGHPTLSFWKYWNKTYQNWSGVEEYFGTTFKNKLTQINYDRQGREVLSKFSLGFTPAANEDETEYIAGASTTTVWTNIEGGLTQKVSTSTTFKTPENALEDHVTDIATWHYDLIGNEVYFFEKHLNMRLGGLVDYETNEYTYENGDLVRSYKYVFGSTLATNILFTYDDLHRVKTQTSRSKSEQGNNEENWTNSNYFEYIWDAQRDIVLDKKAFFWNGAEWNPNWGQGAFYDFEANMSSINMWIGADTKYKLLETRSYVNNDGDWDWFGFNYYYSPVTTGIENQIAYADIKVYPSCVKEQLNVEADGDVTVHIYSIQGMLLSSTSDKSINVSNLSNGIYIVEVNGYKTKIVKE